MRTTKNIKPENWSVLAGSIQEVLCVPGNQDLACRMADAFRRGKPGDYLHVAVAQLRSCVRRTYNGTERARAQSVLETLQNYGLLMGAATS